MPFGLANATAIFQHFMNDIFRDMLDKFVIAYLVDILLFSNNEDKHFQHVAVLQRLRNHHLYAKLEKCEFHRDQVSFLGHHVTKRGITMENDKVKAISDWEFPTNF